MGSLFEMMFVFAQAPSINPLGDWVNKEVGTAIGIVVLIVGIMQWAGGKYGRMVALFVVGGLMFLISKGPETVFNALSSIWKLIFGG